MEPTRHAPGTFCWPELITSDAAGAKKFYAEVMGGWQSRDDDVPGGGSYTMITQDEGNVGGIWEFDEGMRKMGIPPHWLTYVSVENAEETAAKCTELGGTVLRGPMNVMDIGAMAVLQDPTGAGFAVWQPKLRHGTHFVDGRPGSMCWNELMTLDVDKATTFYGNLFGWKPTPGPVPGMEYHVFTAGDQQRAGVMPMPPECIEMKLPSHWMVYFSVADCDAATAAAAANGGTILVPPTDIPNIGRFSALKDPQGAPVSLITMAVPQG